MKTINGNNKIERQINKAFKYLGITLKEESNQYLQIIDIENKTNKFIIPIQKTKLINTKYGEKIMIQSQNMTKPIWISPWKTMVLSREKDTLLFEYNPLNPNQDFQNALEGHDDLIIIEEALKNPYFSHVRKN